MQIKLRSFKKSDYIFITFCFVISVFVFVTTLIRASRTCITYDEAYTYCNYAKDFSISQFFHPNENLSANNHLLNTISIFLLDRLFGGYTYHEFLIRAPVLMTFIIYIAGSYMISKNKKCRYILFGLLTMNYYLNEFFGIARGYAMAAAFVLLSLLFVQKIQMPVNPQSSQKKAEISQIDKKNIFISLGFAIAASFANTIALLYLFSLPVFFLICFLRNKIDILMFIRKNIVLILINLFIVLYLIFYHFMVTSADNVLYYGNLLEMLSLNYGWMLFKNIGLRMALQVVLLLLVGFGLKKTKGKLIKNDDFLLMAISVMMLFVPPLITKQQFPATRLLIPFWPVIAIGLSAVISEICDHAKKIQVNQIYTGAVLGILLISYAHQFNLRGTHDWRYDYVVRDYAYEALRVGTRVSVKRQDQLEKTWIFYEEKILRFNNTEIIDWEE